MIAVSNQHSVYWRQIMNILGGKILTLKDKSETVTINWQETLIPRAQNYSRCQYMTPDGKIVPVYIQSDYSVPESLTVNPPLQCGQQNGVLFFVRHNRKQKPFQSRFLTYANKATLMLDVNTYVGNYLHDVEYTQPESPSGPNNAHGHKATGMSGGKAKKTVLIGEARDVTVHQHFHDKKPPHGSG